MTVILAAGIILTLIHITIALAGIAAALDEEIYNGNRN